MKGLAFIQDRAAGDWEPSITLKQTATTLTGMLRMTKLKLWLPGLTRHEELHSQQLSALVVNMRLPGGICTGPCRILYLLCCDFGTSHQRQDRQWAEVCMDATCMIAQSSAKLSNRGSPESGHNCVCTLTCMIGDHVPMKRGAHKMVDGFALIGEARLVVCLHDTIASPFAHSRAQVGLVALAHFAFATESLQHDRQQ